MHCKALQGAAGPALGFVLLAPCSAQALFDGLPKSTISGAGSSTVALADFDADGDIDFVTETSRRHLGVFENQGDGVFVLAHKLPSVAMGYQPAATGDVDGDGDVDFVSSAGGFLHLFRNYGDGTFAMESLEADTAGVLLLDIEGDGDLDLFAFRGMFPIPGTNQILVNDGQGSFTHDPGRISSAQHFSVAAAAGDIDGDGDVDLIVGTQNTRNLIFINNGSGQFFNRTGLMMPAFADATTDVALGDCDGDGDLDLFVANYDTSRFHRFDGTRYNDEPLPTVADACSNVLLFDPDGDGDLDAWMSRIGNGWTGVADLLFENVGGGTWQPRALPPPHLQSRRAWAADIDGDGDEDLLSQSYQTNSNNHLRVLTNVGGSFHDSERERLPYLPYYVRAEPAIGDVDQDGDPDIVWAEASPGTGIQMLNDGQGWFELGPRHVPGPFGDLVMNFADLDADGDDDYVIAGFATYWNNVGRRLWYRNDGGGVFRPVADPALDTSTVVEVQLTTDVNGDGHPDVLSATDHPPGQSLPNTRELFLNDGLGGFTDVSLSHLPPLHAATWCIEDFDADGDGDLDLFFGNRSAPCQLFMNDGNGIFSDASHRIPPAIQDVTAVAAGDIDGDGDVDLLLGDYLAAYPLLNDGSGAFRVAPPLQRTPTPVYARSVDAIALGDCDEDGDLDVLTAEEYAARLYLNDGRGGFAEHAASALHGGWSGVTLRDLDGDGDLDRILQQGSLATVQFNLSQQLHVPTVPIGGRRARLQIFARGNWGNGAWAFPFWARSSAATPVPGLGVLRLDPNDLHPLPTRFVPRASGSSVEIDFRVPSDPALRGAAMHVQALLFDPQSGRGRLTNAAIDTILP